MEFDISKVFQALYTALKSNENNRLTNELIEGILASAAKPWNDHVKLQQEQDGNATGTDK